MANKSVATLLALASVVTGDVNPANLIIDGGKGVINISKPARRLKVRLTAYWSKPSEDYWTTRGKSSSGSRLVSGKSCAVDTRIIALGSKIRIKDRVFLANDTGSAVSSRKAESGKRLKLPVVDLYFASKAIADREMAKLGKYAVVEIE